MANYLPLGMSKSKEPCPGPATCPHCGTKVVYVPVDVCNWVAKYATNFNESPMVDGNPVCSLHAFKCPHCRALVLTAATFGRDDSGDGAASVTDLYPLPVRPDAAPSVLEPFIRQSYDEARRVLSMSPMSAAVLARRCVQHVIRAKMGITLKTLFAEIQEAVKSPLLTLPIKQSLDHVRQIGNWGAHPVENDQAQTLIEVTPEEAEYTLAVLEALFDDLYVAPARAARMGALLKAKK